MTENIALDRDALYYPYIHIQDANWLKATLLCFPGVRRMIPQNYMPDDSRTVREFCELMGPRNLPLVSSVDLFSSSATMAENNLLKKLQANDAFIRARYSKAKTVEQYGDSANKFNLHDEKIIIGLYSYLTAGPEEKALAWRTTPPKDRPQWRSSTGWLALHPALGSAILSVKAVALANDFGLDIVTDSSGAHQAVATRNEEDIFDQLIGRTVPDRTSSTNDTVDDLAEIVMTTNFDVSALTPKQIAQLLADGKDLRKFKNALTPIAASIPPIKDPVERQRRLKAAAGEIMTEWEKYKKSLPKFAVEAIFDSTEVKWPDVASSIALGSTTAWGVGAGFGLGITLVSYAGVKIWRKYKERASSPYGYLNRVFEVASKSQSFLCLPRIS
jgi:hypothetical protein